MPVVRPVGELRPGLGRARACRFGNPDADAHKISSRRSGWRPLRAGERRWWRRPALEFQAGAARITLQRYTHVLPGELERAREQLDKFLIERSTSVKKEAFGCNG